MLNPRRAAEKSKHRRGLARLFAFVFVVGLALFGVRVGAVRAEVSNQSLVIGRQMVLLANGTKNEIHQVTMNGQTMFFASQMSEESPETILARYREHCEKNAAQSAADWNDLATKAPAPTGTAFGGEKGEKEGAVMCFVRSSQSKTSMVEALAAFDKTGDLGSIGQLRYAYVQKSSKGAHVLAAWTTDSFDTDAILPTDISTDAIGNDFSELPRPEGSLRTFSARINDAPYGVNMYESHGAPKDIAKSYDDLLTKRGWYAVDADGASERSANMKGVTARMYSKDGVMMTVVTYVAGNRTVTALAVGGV